MQVYLTFISGTAVPLFTNGAISYFFNSGSNESKFLSQFIKPNPIANNTQVNINFNDGVKYCVIK